MSHSIRTSHKLAPTLSWFGQVAGSGFRRPRAANHAADISTTSLGARYWIEGASARPSGCLRHRAIRRMDDAPLWIVIPDDARAHRLSDAVTFLRSAKLARGLRHPNVVRTVDSGLLDDGRPFVVLDRLPAISLASWIEQHGGLSWPDVREIALRLCSAVEVARERGIAPRDLDLEGCLHARVGDDPNGVGEVRLGELFVSSSGRAERDDAPAIAMIVHGLLGGDASRERNNSALDNVLMRALGTNGYADVRELARAFAGIEDDGGAVRESHGSNHAEVVGEFIVDVEAEEAAEASRPIPRWSGELELASAS
jgi:hypothetical protein